MKNDVFFVSLADDAEHFAFLQLMKERGYHMMGNGEINTRCLPRSSGNGGGAYQLPYAVRPKEKVLAYTDISYIGYAEMIYGKSVRFETLDQGLL